MTGRTAGKLVAWIGGVEYSSTGCHGGEWPTHGMISRIRSSRLGD
jgi:hypothetical protein